MKGGVLDEETPLNPTRTLDESEDSEESSDGVYRPDFSLFAQKRRWILFLVSTTAFLGPVSVTLFLPAIPTVIKDLETTEAMVDLAVALYMLMLGTVPMIWATLSDRFGRKWTLSAGILTHVVTSIVCGFSPSVGYLIFFRVLQSIGVSSLLVIGAGVVADIYPSEIRGNALGWFTMAPAIGPLFGPIIGGVIAEVLGWRWIFWGSAILAAMFLASTIILLPETLPRSYQPETPKTRMEDEKWSVLVIFRPFGLLLDPKVFILSLANGFCQSTTVAALVLFPITLESNFKMNAIETGLCYLPYGICALFGSTIGGKLSDLLARDFGMGARLFTTLFGVFCYSLSGILFVYAQHLPVILVATSFLGFFFCFQRPGVYSYLIQHYPGDSSGVSASILFIQYTLGFTATLVGPFVWNTETGKFWFFASLSIGTLLVTIPVIFLIRDKWGIFPG